MRNYFDEGLDPVQDVEPISSGAGFRLPLESQPTYTPTTEKHCTGWPRKAEAEVLGFSEVKQIVDAPGAITQPPRVGASGDPDNPACCP